MRGRGEIPDILPELLQCVDEPLKVNFKRSHLQGRNRGRRSRRIGQAAELKVRVPKNMTARTFRIPRAPTRHVIAAQSRLTKMKSHNLCVREVRKRGQRGSRIYQRYEISSAGLKCLVHRLVGHDPFVCVGVFFSGVVEQDRIGFDLSYHFSQLIDRSLNK